MPIGVRTFCLVLAYRGARISEVLALTPQQTLEKLTWEGAALRYPEGVRSVVDADLTVRGNFKAPTLGGSVVVKSAAYTKRVDAPETILDFAIRRSSETGSATWVNPMPGIPGCGRAVSSNRVATHGPPAVHSAGR